MNRAEQEFIARRVADLLRDQQGPPDGGFLTTDQLAKRWALSSRTVRDMLKDGKIASHKFEGARRIKLADVKAYEAAHREEAA